MLERAGAAVAGGVRPRVRRAVEAFRPRRPGRSRRRHRQAAEGRRVVCTDLPDGMSEVWALLPTDGAATLMTTLNAVAAGEKHLADGRTADQRRADALVALAAQRLTDPSLPAWRGRRPSVQVTVNATTLLGLDDQPGELDGHGPSPPPWPGGSPPTPPDLAAAADRPGRRAHRLPPHLHPGRRHGRTSPPATAPAASPAARTGPPLRHRPPAPWDHGGPTVPEQPRMPLPDTTTSNTRPAGPSSATPPANSPGPAPPAAPTDPHHPSTNDGARQRSE